MIKERKTYICYSYVFFTIIFLLNGRAAAQVLTPELPENKWLILAEEQYQQEQYKLSGQSAAKFLSEERNHIYHTKTGDIDKARFYLVVSYLKTLQPGCDDSAEKFIAATANPSYMQRAAYHLGHYYFSSNSFEEAINYFELAGIANLDNHEIANAKFELAYCYFNTKQFDKAGDAFAAIKEIEGKYYDAGNYYYGLLAYNQGKYTEALESFQRIADNKEYRDIVPYYIAEIYYFTDNKQKALDEALKLIKKKEKLYYDNELHLLAAQVLFEQQQYKEALPYFEHYYKNVEKIRKEDLYEMAYCYFMTGQWNNAIEKFKPLSNTRDSLGQTAMYLLGDCYLKTGDKKSARNAFSICSDMPFNKGQQEASLLLTAKLAYEMGYNDEAMNRIRELLDIFPSSVYRNEAKTLLSELLIKTNNYEEAFQAMQEVTNRDAAYRRIYQKVTYGYAMRQLQNGNAASADSLLDLSIDNPADNVYTAVANFWKGDISYKMRRYNDAILYTQHFLQNAEDRGVQTLSPAATPENAYLNMGYAAMENKDFKLAQEYFNRARQPLADGSEIAIHTLLREADAVFMQKDYAQAELLYDKVIAANGAGTDYARFQKAILLGLQGKNAEKTSLLRAIVNSNPPSPYATDARYEMALAYIEEDKYQLAITTLQPLTEAGERQHTASKAWMKTGFSYQQLANTEKAIDAYRKVVLEYPASEERPAALDALKSLYVLNNQPAEYAKLLQENNLSADDLSVDSAYYTAAETQFASGKWANAQKALGEYLTRYPNGIFAAKAHYYKAESHYQLKEYKEALPEYDAVLASPWSNFSENSARQAAIIAFRNQDYNAALNYYISLRNHAMGQENLQMAYGGLMQSSYELGEYKNAVTYADTLLAVAGDVSALANNALLYKARSLSRLDRKDDASEIYTRLENIKNPAIVSEVQYHIAEQLYRKDKLKEAEAAAGKAIQAGGADYWIVKSYILLADILIKQKDYFNAKATLQSVVKNTKIEELKQEANGRLEEVKELEKKQSKLSDQ